MGLLRSEFLRRKRQEAGLSLRAVEERTGISFNHIADIETGKRMPSVDVLHRLCEGIGVSMHEYLVEAGIPYPKKGKKKMDGKGFEPSTPTLRTWCSPS